MKLVELEKQFLEYLEVEKNRSVKTVENYDRYLKRFFTLSGAKNLPDITEDVVRNYRLKLNRIPVRRSGGAHHSGQELKKQTQLYHLIALRSFFEVLS